MPFKPKPHIKDKYQHLKSKKTFIDHHKINGTILMDDVFERIRRKMLAGEPKNEDELAKRLVGYINEFYPMLEWKYDYAGNNLSKAQAGKMSALNKRTGWPDFELFVQRNGFISLCVDLKKYGEKVHRTKDATTPCVIKYKKVRGINKPIPIKENFIRKKGDYFNPHLQSQADAMEILRKNKRFCGFVIGLENTLFVLESWILGDEPMLMAKIVI